MRRKGVMARVSPSATSAQMPEDRIRNSGGFAPSPPLNPSHTQRKRGYKASRKTRGLALPTCFAVQRGPSFSMGTLIVFSKIQAGVQGCDLLAIAVERQGFHARGEEAVADAAFRGLAPARMRDVRVDVGVKTVFVGRDLGPAGDGHVFDQPDLD